MKYGHLTADERYQMDDLRREGFTQEKIAAALNRSPSTISRELSRNKGQRGWRPRQAHQKAAERLSRRGTGNVRRVSDAAWEYAKRHLEEGQWSPDQIANCLKNEGLETISHETIYQRVAEDRQAGGKLFQNLRCKKKRKKRYGSGHSTRGQIPGRVDIDKRPTVVDKRKRIGDWEGDTIIGSHKGGAVIVSMVERKSRLTILAKARNKTSAEVIESISNRMLPLMAFVLTITLDNGREFSMHETLSLLLAAKVFFAKPYHSWERGSNENTNGLVRQYFPKKTSFDRITESELMAVERKLNNRPRKCLGYKTPAEVFNKLCERRGVALRV